MTSAGLEIVPPEARRSDTSDESDRKRVYASFSVPAFTSDGYALVYASIACDGQCGKGWLFLLKLEERAEIWKVLKA